MNSGKSYPEKGFGKVLRSDVIKLKSILQGIALSLYIYIHTVITYIYLNNILYNGIIFIILIFYISFVHKTAI